MTQVHLATNFPAFSVPKSKAGCAPETFSVPWYFLLLLFSLNPDHGTPEHLVWFFLPFDGLPLYF